MRVIHPALLAAVLLAGCAEDPDVYRLEPGDVLNVSALAPVDRAAAQAAVDVWNDAVPGLNLSVSLGAAEWSIRPSDIEAEVGIDANGAFQDGAPVVYLDVEDLREEGREDWTAGVIAHELGHAIGIYAHAKTGLMRGGVKHDLCIDATTAGLFQYYRPDLSISVTCP